jgi:PAS domain S-box-containing protein
MSHAMMNRIRDNQCEVLIQSGADLQSEGLTNDLMQALCSITIEKNRPVLLPDIQKTIYADVANNPNNATFSIRSYVGIPIEIRDASYGSLVFSSPSARIPEHFNKAEIEFIQLFSEWLNSKVHEWELDQSLKSQQKLAKAVSHAQEKFIHGQDQSKSFQGLLRDILDLSGCEFGFIGEVREDKTAQAYLATSAVEFIPTTHDQSALKTDFTGKHYSIKDLDPLFTSAIHTNTATILNSISEQTTTKLVLPNGQKIDNFLGIPIHYNDQLVAMIGLANRPFGFHPSFIDFLAPILLTIGQLVQAARVQVQHTESERRLADIIKGTNIGTWEWNVQTGESSFNHRWAEIIGYDLKEISPTDINTWIHFTHPDDVKKSNELLQKHFDGELDYYETVIRMRHKDGHWVWILDRGCLVSRTADGKPLMMSGSHADISNQKEAEAQLANAYDLLEQSNTIARIGTWEIDVQNRQLSWSKVTKEIYEVPNDFVCPIEQAIHFYREGKDQETITQLLQRAVHEGRSFDIELSIMTYTKKERWVRIVGISKFNEQVCERVYGTIQDISERKHIEKMRDEFISTVSHELRTPLTSISGALSLMVNGVMGEFPEKLSSMLQIAHKNSQRLSFLINDLLDMEKILAGKLKFNIERLPLAPLLKLAVDSNMGAGIERMISISIDNPHQDIHIAVDTQRMLQVLSNVISNAIKYSPNHGHIQLTVRQDQTRVRITIIDQGPGIPAEFQSRIFQKFAQADSSDTRQRGGTGLGLAISKELIEAMHGNLSFSSVYGQGASFFVDLPVMENR